MKELKISEYSFHEFLQSFQTAVIEGYRLDLDSNERFPQKFGSHMEVTLVVPEAVLPQVTLQTEPQSAVTEEQSVPEVNSETVTTVKTRKGK